MKKAGREVCEKKKHERKIEGKKTWSETENKYLCMGGGGRLLIKAKECIRRR